MKIYQGTLTYKHILIVKIIYNHSSDVYIIYVYTQNLEQMYMDKLKKYKNTQVVCKNTHNNRAL